MSVRARIFTFALTWLGLFGQPAPARAAEPGLRIVVLRHGVRSPTKPPESLAAYADQPWARWPVAPGMLTPHGVAMMRALGAWWASELQAERRIGKGCGAGRAVSIVADSTPRNRASAAALSDGLLPGCPRAGYFALASGQHDPLFQGLKDSDDEGAEAPAGAVEVPRDRLAELQAVLVGGGDEARLAAARASRKKLLVDMPDPTRLMGSLAENLMLEHAEGMPSPAWGRADADVIGRLIELHNISFARSWVGSPVAARQRASDLLARIAASFGPGRQNSLAGPDTRVVFLVGHDSNLAALAGLLGLDWHDPRQPDDYPPGGALVFDLANTSQGPAVQVSTVMPTLAALRSADVAAPGALVRRNVALPACGAQPCPLSRFRAAVEAAIDPNAVATEATVRPFVPR
jgi:4-phytase/acid phosphatase